MPWSGYATQLTRVKNKMLKRLPLVRVIWPQFFTQLIMWVSSLCSSYSSFSTWHEYCGEMHSLLFYFTCWSTPSQLCKDSFKGILPVSRTEMIISQIGYKFNQFSNFPLVVNYPQVMFAFLCHLIFSLGNLLKWLEVMKVWKCLFQIVGSVLHQLEAQHRCEYLFIIQTQQSKQFHFVPFFLHTMIWIFLCDGQWLCLTWKKAWMERKGRETLTVWTRAWSDWMANYSMIALTFCQLPWGVRCCPHTPVKCW